MQFFRWSCRVCSRLSGGGLPRGSGDLLTSREKRISPHLSTSLDFAPVEMTIGFLRRDGRRRLNFTTGVQTR